MKYLLVFCLLTTVAQARTVKAVFETGGYSSLCTLNDDTIDYSQGVLELEKNAESQCKSNARRVSDLVIKTECKDLHVWGAVGLYVSFKASYECF